MKIKESYDYDLMISELNKTFPRLVSYQVIASIYFQEVFQDLISDASLSVTSTHSNRTSVFTCSMIYDMCLRDGVLEAAKFIIRDLEEDIK